MNPPPFDPLQYLEADEATVQAAKAGKISTRSDLVPCPYCGAEIAEDLPKCRQCGEFVKQAPAAASTSAPLVCLDCGSPTAGETVTAGSLAIEILLWLLMLLPGVLYSVWRLTTRHRACTSCGGRNLVPSSSPRGRELLLRRR